MAADCGAQRISAGARGYEADWNPDRSSKRQPGEIQRPGEYGRKHVRSVVVRHDARACKLHLPGAGGAWVAELRDHTAVDELVDPRLEYTLPRKPVRDFSKSSAPKCRCGGAKEKAYEF